MPIKFETGPFAVSVDLGMHCSDININEPAKSEHISGYSYTRYSNEICRAFINFIQYESPFDYFKGNYEEETIKSDLISLGADKDTIYIYERIIDSKPGAVGSGYIPKYDSNFYEAGFYVSPRTVCHILVWENESQMLSILKTIRVTEKE